MRRVPQPGERERLARLQREPVGQLLPPIGHPLIKTVSGNQAPLLAQDVAELVADGFRTHVDRLAQLVEPNLPWRIVTSDAHSTVWNGKGMLFEFNFLALGLPPDECFEMADFLHLKPGKERKVSLPLRDGMIA